MRWLSRLFAVLIVGCAVALVVAGAVVHEQVTPVASSGYTPVEVPAEAAVPQLDAASALLLDADKARTDSALRATVGRRQPFLDRAAGVATAVLPGPGRYTMGDLPKAAVSLREGTVRLRLPLVVGPRARLVITQRRLLLRSSPTVRAYVAVIGGTLVVRGTRITTIGPDLEPRDGRAYLQVQGGRMTLRGVHVSHLGYATGRTSGVAWMHRFGVPSTGSALDSTFTHNLFGVYSSGADGLRFVRDRFLHNDVYGFDPHGAPPGMGNSKSLGSNRFVVRDSVAAYNGRHGFIFSSGCNDNRVLNAVAHHNGGNGFVIDDGRPRSGLVNPSNNNLLRGIEAHDNGGVGVVIEGGTANLIQDALLVNNSFGVRITAATRDAVISGTSIHASRWTALAILDRARALAQGVRIDGATVGVESSGGSRLQDVSVNDAVVTGLRLEPTDVVVGVRVSGAGHRAVDGIQQVQLVGWHSDQPDADDLTLALSSVRHQVWLLLLLTPLLLWSVSRLVHRVRNLTTRTGL